MRKKGFTIIEVVAVFLLILGVTFFVLPMSLDNTKQASYISQWKTVYEDAKYMFSVIKAQNGIDLEEKLSKAANNNVRTNIILYTIRPYLRVKTGVDNGTYKQSYMNQTKVPENDKYFIENFYYTDSEKIVGLKWLTANCDEETVCGIMVFDVNGTTPPNVWGKDVFGINILKNGIEPIGKDVPQEILKNDCSGFGHGLYCSYYYLIGGQFD